MKYDKPEVVKVANAVHAIQGESKETDITSDNLSEFVTTTAYQADE